MPLAASLLCCVCKKERHKYRCAGCGVARYCSLACYKEHKKVCEPRKKPAADRGTATPGKRQRASASSAAAGGSSRSSTARSGASDRGRAPNNKRQRVGRDRYRRRGRPQAYAEPEEGEPGYLKVTPEALARVERSDAVREAVSDPVLQALLRDVLAAPRRLQALEHARRTNRRFADFCDTVLVTTGVCTRRDDGTVQFVGPQ